MFHDTDILFKELQPGKELLCIVFTVFGILIFFNEERLLKVEFSIEVIDGGRSISVSAMHFEKAYCPIETTESWIIIFDNKKQLEKDKHSKKADFLIIVTEGGIWIWFNFFAISKSFFINRSNRTQQLSMF